MGGGNEERGYSYIESLIKGYGREKRLSCAGLKYSQPIAVAHLTDSKANSIVITQLRDNRRRSFCTLCIRVVPSAKIQHMQHLEELFCRNPGYDEECAVSQTLGLFAIYDGSHDCRQK
jgi:hypothetical protein